MIIDVSNVENGHELTYLQVCRLKSAHIYQGVKKINDKRFNYLLVSVDVGNVLDNHIDFKKSSGISKEEGLYYIGELLEFKVYVDLYLSPNSIILSFDKQTRRDVRLDSLLNGSVSDDYMEVTVEY